MKTLEYYLALPYTKVLRRDDEGDIVARIEELPGCVAHGANDAEALERLEDVQAAWIEEFLSAGQPIPEPRNPPQPIKLSVLNDRAQHFLVTFNRPGRIEVTMVDGAIVAHVYEGAAIDAEQDPLGAYDGTGANRNWNA